MTDSNETRIQELESKVEALEALIARIHEAYPMSAPVPDATCPSCIGSGAAISASGVCSTCHGEGTR